MKWLLLILFLWMTPVVQAQLPDNIIIKKEGNQPTPPRPGQVQIKDTATKKGFQQRDDLQDSITISYRYLDSTRRITIDSSVNDFDQYFPIPTHHVQLGNNGAATQSLLFQPYQEVGFDPGFHAYDIYKYTLANTKIYRTTRPFSMLGYQLASGKEQMLMASHTQNPKPNLNFGFDYRLISAPGLFVTQNNNHNSYRLYGNYVGKRKRYQGTFVLVGNNIRASQNGGIVADSFLQDPNRKDRFTVPVNMGNQAGYRTNPFVTKVNTGITYRDFNVLLRQSWDVGQKDSLIINDTTTEYLFYPRIRFQHSLTYSNQSYGFNDIYADSALYAAWFGQVLTHTTDTFSIRDQWKVIGNDFSIITFPDAKNPAQFLQLGAAHAYYKGTTTRGAEDFSNISIWGEYRNRTRNKKWDFLMKGQLYLTGYNSGDYLVQGSFSRNFGQRWGDVRLEMKMVNREPSYLQDGSAFNLSRQSNFDKIHHTVVGAVAQNSLFTLGVRNHFIVNYLYYNNDYHIAQQSDPINLLQLYATRKTKLGKRWNWYADVMIQQVGDNAPIHIPFLYTRNRIAFEGNFFKNLHLSTGIEARYYTSYKADNFIPIISQFANQDAKRIENRPDIAAFFHFRIRSFTGYIRAENLNTLDMSNGFSFTHNNFAAPFYPTQGLMIRFGIRWWFVN